MDPALLIIGFVMIALSVCFAAWSIRRAAAENPRAVVRRCRLSLMIIWRDLDRLPATREICDLYDETERADRAIDRAETKATGVPW